MNYKTIFLGAVIGASMQNAHGMDANQNSAPKPNGDNNPIMKQKASDIVQLTATITALQQSNAEKDGRIKELEDTIARMCDPMMEKAAWDNSLDD
jgi:hypothetical protein